MTRQRALGGLLKFAITAMVLIGMGSAPAGADPTSVVSPIRAGNQGTVVGSATFARTSDPTNGTERLNVRLAVPLGMDQAHLCLSTTAFTSRVPPGSCPYKHENLNAAKNDEFDVSLGTTYVGQKLYAQLHVATTAPPQTAYAGWTQAQGGGAFYGNVEIDPSPVPGVPAAPLVGAGAPLVAGVAFAASAGFVVWRRTRRPAVDTRAALADDAASID